MGGFRRLPGDHLTQGGLMVVFGLSQPRLSLSLDRSHIHTLRVCFDPLNSPAITSNNNSFRAQDQRPHVPKSRFVFVCVYVCVCVCVCVCVSDCLCLCQCSMVMLKSMFMSTYSMWGSVCVCERERVCLCVNGSTWMPGHICMC